MKHKIYFTREKRGLKNGYAKKMIKDAIYGALEAENVDVPCEISVLLTDDDGIQELNRNFREIDRSTDVLSFPNSEFEPEAFDENMGDFNPKTGRLILGDMAISLEHVVAQGIEFGHGSKREIMYLTVHSILHLLGYDHMDEGEMKKQMRRREKEIMYILEGVMEDENL